MIIIPYQIGYVGIESVEVTDLLQEANLTLLEFFQVLDLILGMT